MDFRLLGRLEVDAAARPFAMAGTRTPAVLATLLIHANRTVSLDHLAEGVWMEPPRAAGSNLRTYVAQLREAFVAASESPSRLATEAGGYRLEVGTDELDVTRFDRLADAGEQALRHDDPATAVDLLRRALDLWRDDALAGLTAGPLLHTEAARLDQRRLAVARRWADAALAAGRPDEAAVELARLVRVQPLDEQAWGQLMLALYRSGRQGEALAAYRQAYKTLDEELGVAPGRPLQDLHQRMLAGDPALDPPASVSVTRSSASRMPTPRQLPPDVVDFTGRQSHVQWLDKLLDTHDRANPTAVVVSAVAGTAGVGKTALAAHWAHRVVDRFTDGQLFVDLRGYAPGPPVHPVDALSGFLRALGIAPDDVPAEQDEAAALYRSLLADRRVLVLLDNAASADQVRPLLPASPTSMVIVTSRDGLAGLVASNGARRIDLDALTPAEADALLAATVGTDRVQAEPAAAAAIARLCAYLPLALRIAAARLSEQPHRSLAQYAADLAGQDRLDSLAIADDPGTGVAAAFAYSCARLPAPARRLFGLLGLLDAPDIDTATAARLLDASVRTTTTELQTLVRAHLVHSPVPGRFHMHDLLRLYARRCALADQTADERSRAVRRVAQWQLRLVERARQVAYPAVVPEPRPTETAEPEPGCGAEPELRTGDEAQHWFATERRNLLATTRQIAEPGSGRLAAHLCLALERLVTSDGFGGGWEPLVTQVLAAARADGEDQLAGLLTNVCAAIRFQRGDLRGAAAHFAEAADVFHRIGERRQEVATRMNYGASRQRLGHLRDAAREYVSALSIARDLGDQRVEAYALANLASVRRELGRYQDAERYARAACAMFHRIGDWQGEADGLNELGLILVNSGQAADAVGAHRAALALVAHRDRRRAAGCLRELGDSLAASGDIAQAKSTLREAVRALVEVGAAEAQAARQSLAALERPTTDGLPRTATPIASNPHSA